jgi:hypothetical protein
VDEALEVASLDLGGLDARDSGPVTGEVWVGGHLLRVLDPEALAGVE